MNAPMNAQVQQQVNESPAAARLRCLWVSRDIPFPQDAGDRIYSANIASALAHAADVEVRFLGYLQADAAQVPHDWVSNWVAVNGAKRSEHVALLSRYPRIAAVHATRSYRELLQQQLQEPWDAIVLDGYASGWALSACVQARAQQGAKGKAPVLVYLSHNHEESLWKAMTEATHNLSIKRLGVWQNYRKARALERAMVDQVDLVTTITPEDAHTYGKQQRATAKAAAKVVLTPGYAGPTRATRRISSATPRHVVMMGSYRWLIKQENLRRLVQLADPVFAERNIVLDVIGDVPEELYQELQPQVRATRFHGFVTDVSSYFDAARLALVPEVVGGGFKLKFLDYVFGRVPVVTIQAASAGVPQTLADCMLPCADLQALVNTVARVIDDVETLDRLQDQAYHRAASLFRWQDRGSALANAIRQRGAGA
jgi:glycosyltransferase involved in cell wall biosynthesis